MFYLILFLGLIISGTTIASPQLNNNYSTKCGEVLTGTKGLIEYKLNEDTIHSEHCLWTIRTPFRTQIRFTLNWAGFENGNVHIYTYDSKGVKSTHIFLSNELGSVVLNGTVASVMFVDRSYEIPVRGFSLGFDSKPNQNNELVPVFYYEDQHSILKQEQTLNTMYPADGQYYRNNELSTFTFIREGEWTGPRQILMNFTSMDLEFDASDGESCRDVLHVYRFVMYRIPGWPENSKKLERYTPEKGICLLPYVNHPLSYIHEYAFIVILATDGQQRGRGFSIELWASFH